MTCLDPVTAPRAQLAPDPPLGQPEGRRTLQSRRSALVRLALLTLMLAAPAIAVAQAMPIEPATADSRARPARSSISLPLRVQGAPQFGLAVRDQNIASGTSVVLHRGDNRWQMTPQGGIVLADNPTYGLTLQNQRIHDHERIVLSKEYNFWSVRSDGSIVLRDKPSYGLTVFHQKMQDNGRIILHRGYNQWSRLDVIEVTEASYGTLTPDVSCLRSGAPDCHQRVRGQGNATRALGQACDGRRRCDYRVDHRVLGDPQPGVVKKFRVTWSCGGMGSQTLELPGEASGRSLTLSCPASVGLDKAQIPPALPDTYVFGTKSRYFSRMKACDARGRCARGATVSGDRVVLGPDSVIWTLDRASGTKDRFYIRVSSGPHAGKNLSFKGNTVEVIANDPVPWQVVPIPGTKRFALFNRWRCGEDRRCGWHLAVEGDQLVIAPDPEDPRDRTIWKLPR